MRHLAGDYLLARADRLQRLCTRVALALCAIPVLLALVNLFVYVFRGFWGLIAVIIPPSIFLAAYGSRQKAGMKKLVEGGELVRGRCLSITDGEIFIVLSRVIPIESIGRLLPVRTVYYEFEVEEKKYQNTQLIFTDEEPMEDEGRSILVFVDPREPMITRYIALCPAKEEIVK